MGRLPHNIFIIGKVESCKKIWQTLKAGLPCYEKLTRGNGSGGDDLMEAECHYHSGDFVSAEIFLNKAIRKALPAGQWGIELATMFLQTRIDLMKGDLSKHVSSACQYARGNG